MSSTVRNTVVSGKLLKGKTYIDDIFVEMYDDDTVTIFDGGVAYDGNVDTLINVCKAMGAKLVYTYVPEVPSPVSTEEDPIHSDNLDDEEPYDDCGDLNKEEPQVLAEPDCKIWPATDIARPVKEYNVPLKFTKDASGDLTVESYTRMNEYQFRAARRVLAVTELVRASRAGCKPDKAILSQFVENGGHESLMPKPGDPDYRHGGSINDLLDKIRNNPERYKFSKDARRLFSSKEEWDAERSTSDVLTAALGVYG